jgi:hypothetical protein
MCIVVNFMFNHSHHMYACLVPFSCSLIAIIWTLACISLFSGTQAENDYIRAEETKYCAMKLSQIRRKIELYMREMILRLEMNL